MRWRKNAEFEQQLAASKDSDKGRISAIEATLKVILHHPWFSAEGLKKDADDKGTQDDTGTQDDKDIQEKGAQDVKDNETMT